jgi:glycosyltransferase AglD
MKSVLVTVPIRNEAKFLDASVRTLLAGLDASGLSYRLALAEDGSTDATPQILARLQREFPLLIVQTSPVRRGRGWALRELWSRVDADIYAFVDADLAAGPPALLRVVRAVQDGADVATGSRYCDGARVHRPPLRQQVSLGYNWLVRLVFHDRVRDHQCGLKAFTRDAKTDLFAMTREYSWAWDTEVIVLAVLAGMRVVEVPVEWTEFRGTRTPLRRLLSDVYLHGAALVRLKSGLRQAMQAKRARIPAGFGARPVDLVGPQDSGGGLVR